MMRLQGGKGVSYPLRRGWGGKKQEEIEKGGGKRARLNEPISKVAGPGQILYFMLSKKTVREKKGRWIYSAPMRRLHRSLRRGTPPKNVRLN